MARIDPTSLGTGRDAHAEPPHVLLAGGGSGGHVFPALAIGAELARRGWSVSFAGRPDGMERDLAVRAGLAFHPLAARPLVGRGRLGQVTALATLAGSALAGRRLVRRLGARVTVGTGGFAAAPAVLGCRLARRPALLVEPNADAGTANRLLSRWASFAALAFESTGRQLRCPSGVTGVPVRPAFFELPAVTAHAAERPRLLVLGGSQGALQLNQALPAALAAIRARVPGLRVLHQCGAAHAEITARAYAEAGLGDDPAIEVTPFLDDVAGAMAESHLIVTRAGAITTAEICAAGRAALFVPLAIAGGHQVENARALEAAGAARLVPHDQAEPARLATELAALLTAPDELARMGAAARALAKPGAVAAIADHVERLAGHPLGEPGRPDTARSPRGGAP